MMLAGHLPTMRFTLDFWRSMPVWVPKYEGDMAPDGYSRVSHPRSGKPLVIYCAPVDSWQTSFAVRPIVRVPMGRRVSPSTVDRETVRKFQKRYLRALAAGAGGWAGP